MNRWVRVLLLRLSALFRPQRKADELEDEIAFHLQMQIEENLRNGMNPEKARAEAIREFGGGVRYREECRDAWGTRTVTNLLRDVRVSCRSLMKHKGFTSTCVLTLGLGIGANAAIFTILNAALLKPLPLKEPEKLVEVYNTYSDVNYLEKYSSNFPLREDYSENTTAFESVSLYRPIAYTYYKDNDAAKVTGAYVTHDFFDTLGVEPFLGRLFIEADTVEGNDDKIVLSFELWKTLYDGDPGIVGATLEASGKSLQVIGVAPPGIEAIDKDHRFYRTVNVPENLRNEGNRHINRYRFIGRLKDGVSIEEAQTQIRYRDKIYFDNASSSRQAKLERWRHLTMISPLKDVLVDDIRPSLYLLQGSSFLVLLVACFILANLTLARSSTREFEFGIRQALGSGRVAIIRQQLVECGILSASGGLLALVLSSTLLIAFNALGAIQLQSVHPIRFGRETLALTLAATTGVGLVLGMVSSTNLLRQGSSILGETFTRTATSSKRAKSTRAVLVTCQIGISFLLLFGSGLLFRSFSNASNRDLGYNPNGVSVFRILIPVESYTTSETLAPFQNLLLDSINSVAGVESASLSAQIPVYENHWPAFFSLPTDATDQKSTKAARLSVISPGYFDTMGIRFAQGRDFERLNGGEVSKHLIISRNLADRYFAYEDPIGQRMTIGEVDPKTASDWPTVIGVVENAIYDTAKESELSLNIYRNVMNHDYDHDHKDVTILIKSDRAHSELESDVRRELKRIDNRVPIVSSGPLDDYIKASMDRERVVLWLASAFSSLSLLLASIGLYGLVAYDVHGRHREIGIRIALGADNWSVVRHLFKRSFRMTVVGIVIGTALSIPLAGTISPMLYRVTPFDASTYVSILAFVIAVSSAASLLPITKHLRSCPTAILRSE